MPFQLTRRSPVFLALLCGRTLFSQQAAGTGDDLATLMELLNTPVVTASKVAQKASDAPATVVVVTAEQIRRRGYKSLLQVLQDLPDYKVEKRSDPEWYTDFTVRGINGQDTFVILLDGMKITPSTNERIPIMENYPVHMAKQIEVVYGPASALYGADAVSGVINIITKEGKAGSGFEAESTLRTDGDKMRLANFHGNYEFAPGVRLTVGGQWFYDPLPELDKSWPDFKGFQYQRAGGPFPTAFGSMPFPGGAPFDKDPAYPEKTRAFYAFLKIDEFVFRVFRNSAKVSSSLTYNADNSIANENVFLDQAVTVLGAQYSKDLGTVTLQTNLTESRYDLDPTSNFRNAYSNMEPAYKYADSSAFKAEQQITWAPSKAWTVVGGASYEVLQAIPWSTDLQSPVDTSQSVKGYLRGQVDGQWIPADFFPLKYSNTGAYLQTQYIPREDLILTLGARQDGNSRYGSTFNPRAGLVWHLNNRNTIKVLYGSAFLAPSPLLAYAHFGSFRPPSPDHPNGWYSDYWRLPNPGLKPLKEKTFELGYQSTLTSNFNFSLSLYQTKLTDLHQLVVNNAEAMRLYGGKYKGYDVFAIELRTNLGKQTNTGGTARLDYLQNFGENRKLTAYLSFSHVDGKLDQTGDGHEVDIGLISPTLLRTGVELQWGSWSLSTRYTKVGEQRFASRDSNGTPYPLDGYGNLDLHLLWDVQKNVGIFLDGSNVTDTRYRNINHEWDPSPYTPAGRTEYRGVPQDPRRIGIGVQVRF